MSYLSNFGKHVFFKDILKIKNKKYYLWNIFYFKNTKIHFKMSIETHTHTHIGGAMAKAGVGFSLGQDFINIF